MKQRLLKSKLRLPIENSVRDWKSSHISSSRAEWEIANHTYLYIHLSSITFTEPMGGKSKGKCQRITRVVPKQHESTAIEQRFLVAVNGENWLPVAV